MSGKLAKVGPKTVGHVIVIGTGIVAGAILWWFGRDVYEWMKAACRK